MELEQVIFKLKMLEIEFESLSKRKSEYKDVFLSYNEAIETVLQELKNSISKEKIKDKINCLDEMLNNSNKEVIYPYYRYTRNILEELLGDKIDEDIKYRPFTK